MLSEYVQNVSRFLLQDTFIPTLFILKIAFSCIQKTCKDFHKEYWPHRKMSGITLILQRAEPCTCRLPRSGPTAEQRDRGLPWRSHWRLKTLLQAGTRTWFCAGLWGLFFKSTYILKVTIFGDISISLFLLVMVQLTNRSWSVIQITVCCFLLLATFETWAV